MRAPLEPALGLDQPFCTHLDRGEGLDKITSNSLMDYMKPETLALSLLEPLAQARMAFLKVSVTVTS